MGIFDEVRGRVSLEEAARRYGLQVGRGRMALCPFHEDHHPSMKLYDDHFYCFTCGSHGDTADLVAKLTGKTPYEAAKELVGACAGPTRPKPQPIAPEKACLRAVNRYIHLLCTWRELYHPVAGREPDERYLEAVQMLPAMEDLSDLLTYGPKADREACAREMEADGRLIWLEQRVQNRKEIPNV